MLSTFLLCLVEFHKSVNQIQPDLSLVKKESELSKEAMEASTSLEKLPGYDPNMVLPSIIEFEEAALKNQAGRCDRTVLRLSESNMFTY